MRAKVQFGCLQDREMLHVGHAMSNMRRVVDQYQYHRMQFDIPEQGVTKTEITCPICSQLVTIRLDNPKGVFWLFRLAFAFVGLVCFGLAAGIYYGPGKGSDVVQMIALGIAVLGALFWVAAVLADQLPISLVKDSLVSISKDTARDQIQAAGNTTPRRHQLLDIHIG
jgi:hypothetical protein